MAKVISNRIVTDVIFNLLSLEFKTSVGRFLEYYSMRCLSRWFMDDSASPLELLPGWFFIDPFRNNKCIADVRAARGASPCRTRQNNRMAIRVVYNGST
jgi:hypothetical protein